MSLPTPINWFVTSKLKNKKRNLVILISGRGSNMQTIHKQITAGKINAKISAVISNNPDAAGLKYADEQGVTNKALNHRDFTNRETFDQALIDLIDLHEPDYVILAGFMRILGQQFVEHYHGRLLNIHPSLLPKYKGLHTHKRALDAGDSEHGASVHFVTPDLDAGPVIIQTKVAIRPAETEQSLEECVLQMEHKLYPAAIALLCQGLIKQGEDCVMYDGETLKAPLLLT